MGDLPEMRRILFSQEHIQKARARAAARAQDTAAEAQKERETAAALQQPEPKTTPPKKEVEPRPVQATKVQRSTKRHGGIDPRDAVASRKTLNEIKDNEVAPWTYVRKEKRPHDVKSTF